MLSRGRGNNNYRPYSRGRGHPPVHFNRGFRGGPRHNFHTDQRYDRGRSHYYSKEHDYRGDYRRQSRGRSGSPQRRRRSTSRSPNRSRSRSRSRSHSRPSSSRSARSSSRSPYRKYSRSRSRSVSSSRRLSRSHPKSFRRSASSRSRSRSFSKGSHEEKTSRNNSGTSSSAASRSSSSHTKRSADREPIRTDSKAELINIKDSKARSTSPSIDLSLRITVGNEKYLEQKSMPTAEMLVTQNEFQSTQYSSIPDRKPDRSREEKVKKSILRNAGANVEEISSNLEQSIILHSSQGTQKPTSAALEAEILKHISTMPSYLKDDISKKEWLLGSLSGVLANRKLPISAADASLSVTSGFASVTNKPDILMPAYEQFNDFSLPPPVIQSRAQVAMASSMPASNFVKGTSLEGPAVGSLGGGSGGGGATEVEDEDLYLYGDESAASVGGNKSQSNEGYTSHVAYQELGGYPGSHGNVTTQPSVVAQQQAASSTSQLSALINDPTIGSILKSIGISVDTAQGLQSQTSLEQSIDQGSSFLSGGMPSVDLGKVFAKDEADAASKRKRRRVPDTYESYEERARKYREEQMKAIAAAYESANEPFAPQSHSDYEPNEYENVYHDGGQVLGIASSQAPPPSGLEIIQQYDMPVGEPLKYHSTEGHDFDSRHGNMDYHHDNRDPKYDSFERGRGALRNDGYDNRDRVHHENAYDEGRLGQMSNNEEKREYGESNRYVVDEYERSKPGKSLKKSDQYREHDRRESKRVMSKRDLDILKKEIDIKYSRLKLLDRELGRLQRDKSDILMRPKWSRLTPQEEDMLYALSKEEKSLQRELDALRLATEECEQQMEEGRAALLAEQRRQEEEEAKKRFSGPTQEKSAESLKTDSEDKKPKVEMYGAVKPAGADTSKKEPLAPIAADAAALKEKKKMEIHLEFTDGGSHWCRTCSLLFSSVEDYCKHVHDKKHRKLIDPTDNPWASMIAKNASSKSAAGKTVVVPFRGSEFVLGVRAYFCSLCREFAGDAECAMAHLKTKQHDDKYQQYISEYPVYEKNLNLEKNAAMAKSIAEESKFAEKPRDIEQLKEKKYMKGDDGESYSAKEIEERSKKLVRQSEDDERKRMIVGAPGTKRAAGAGQAFTDFVWKGQSQKRIRIDLNSSDSDSEKPSSTTKPEKNRSDSSQAKRSSNKEPFVFVPPVSKSKWELDEDGERKKAINDRLGSRFQPYSVDSNATREMATELLRKKAESKARDVNSTTLDMFQGDGSEKSKATKSEGGRTLFPITSAKTADANSKGKDSKDSSKKSKESKSKDLLAKGDLKPTPPPQMAPTAGGARKPQSSLTASGAKDLYGVFFNKGKDEDNDLAKSVENAKKAAAALAAQANAGNMLSKSPPSISANMPTLADKQAASAAAKKSAKLIPTKKPPVGVVIAPLKSLKMLSKTGNGKSNSNVLSDKPPATSTVPTVTTTSSTTTTAGQSSASQDNDDAKSDTSEINAGDFDIVDEL